MTKTKSTKRALLMSALALVLCVSMLVGSTYAWFTDSVTSGRNKIVSGNLDVVLEYKTPDTDWAEVTSDTVLFNEDSLWEPGHTEVVALRVKNAGSLAIKYDLATIVYDEVEGTNVAGETFKLSEYLDVYSCDTMEEDGGIVAQIMQSLVLGNRDRATGNGTIMEKAAFGECLATDDNLVPGEAHFTFIAIQMPETVGNEANYKTGTTPPSISFGVTVMATQATYESDSFDNQYDKDAKNATVVSDLAELKAALAAGDDVALGNDITVNGNISLKADAAIYGYGNSLVGAQLYVGNDSLVKDVEFVGVSAEKGSQIYAHDVSVVLDGCTFDSAKWDAIQYTTNTADVTLTVNNCTFKNTDNTAYRYIHVELLNDDAEKPLRDQADNGVKVVMTNNTFENVDTCKDDAIGIYGVVAENVTTSGNTATAASEAAALAKCWFGEHTTGAWTTYSYDPFDSIVVIVADLSKLDEALESGATEIDAGGATLGDFYYDAKFTDGATIKNAKFTYFYGGNVEGTVTFENCEFVSDYSYAANFDSGNGNIIFNNCLFDGWSSFGTAITGVEMNNCTFQKTYDYGVLRFYQDAVLNNCTFADSFEGIDTNVTGTEVHFNNCTGIDGKIFNNGDEVGKWFVDGKDISNTVTSW